MFSIIIPTINRSQFIELNLNFLSIQKFNGQVLIGDSSNDLNYNKTKLFIKKKKFNFEIIHKHLPNLSAYECIAILKKKINFKYAMWIPDDDLLLTMNVKKCINFLDKNRDYSACGGKMAIIELNKDNKIVGLGSGKFRSMLNNNALDRLSNLSEDYYVAQYAISRSKEFKKRYNFSNNHLLPIIGAEVLPTFYLTAFGKIFQINDFFCMRLVHSNQILSNAAKGDYSIFKSKIYKKSKFFLINEISKYLSKKDKLPKSFIVSKMSKFLFIFENKIKNKKKNKKKIINYLTGFMGKIIGKNYFAIKICIQANQLFKKNKTIKIFKELQNLIQRIFK